MSVLSKTVKRLYRTGRVLDEIAGRKSLVNVTAIADYTISPSGLADKEWAADEVAEKMEEALQAGILLALKAKPKPIWVVVVPEGHGDCMFFFIGEYQEILKKLRELPDEWT
jgi:hypothetical protein